MMAKLGQTFQNGGEKSKINFTGKYEYTHPFFENQHQGFLICTRKNPTPTKPVNFLRAYVPLDRRNSSYFSSLYPTAKLNTFRSTPAGGKTIYLTFAGNEVFIKEKP
jgi:hypothetical protein